jgi:hypothetical protein
MLFGVVLSIILWGIATVLLVGGGNIIRSQRHDFRWTSHSSADSLTEAHEGTHLFEGREAVVFGTGLCSFGGMLFVWGAALFWGTLTRGAVEPRLQDISLSPLALLLTWLSLMCFVVGCVAIFPPWHLNSYVFFGVVIFWAAFGLLMPPDIARRVGPQVFLGQIVATIAIGWFFDDFSFAIFASLFATIILWTHALLLFRRVREYVAEHAPLDELDTAE